MDPEPAAGSRPSTDFEISSRSSHQHVREGIDDEDPFSLSGTSIALLGLAIAIAVVGVPLLAIVTDRPVERESLVPTAFQSDGSKSPIPISLSRTGKPGRRNPSGKQK